MGLPLEGDAMHPLEIFIFKTYRCTIAVNGIPGKIILLQLIILVVTMKELLSL